MLRVNVTCDQSSGEKSSPGGFNLQILLWNISYEIRSIGAEFRILSPQKSMPIGDFAPVVSADREAISRKPYH
jgi:hypothetical protein